MDKKRKYIVSGVAVFLVLCLTGVYIWYHKRVILSSDSTTMLPVAIDLMHGNVLLKDWVLGTNNFFFSETIFYIPGLLLGISAHKLLIFIPAITIAAFIALSAYVFIWKDKRCESVRDNIITTVLYVLITGSVAYQTAYTLLNANSHNGVYLFITVEILLVFLYIRDNRKKYIIIYTVIGALMLFSDGVYLMALIAPVCAMSCYYILVGFIKKEKEKTVTYIWVFGATVVSFIAGKLIGVVLHAAGGLETRGIPMHVVSLKEAVHRLFEYKNQVLTMWGYNVSDNSLTEMIYNSVVIIILVATAIVFIYQIVDIIKGRIDTLRLILWLIVFFNIAGCLFTDTVIFYRYIVPSYLYGTMLVVLAVRTLLSKLKDVKEVYISTGIVLLACSLLVSVYRFSDAAEKPGNIMQDRQDIAQYIIDNNLGNGYGDFWIASVVSCYTDYKNDIYPIVSNENGLNSYVELINNKWYEQKDMHYIITNADDANNLFCKKEQAVAAIGEPDRQQVIGTFEIMYWNKDISDYVKVQSE